MKKFLILILCLTMVSTGYATEGWVTITEIDEVIVGPFSNGSYTYNCLLIVDGTEPNILTYVYVLENNEVTKTLSAAAFSAINNNKSVDVYLTGSVWPNGYKGINRIRLYK